MRKFSENKCEHSSKKTKFWINTKYNIDLRTTRRQYIRQFIDFLENNFSAVKIFLLKTQNKIYYGKNQNNSDKSFRAFFCSYKTHDFNKIFAFREIFAYRIFAKFFRIFSQNVSFAGNPSRDSDPGSYKKISNS